MHGDTPERTPIFAKREQDAQVPVCVAAAKTPESAIAAASAGATLRPPKPVERHAMKIVRPLFVATLFAVALPASARKSCEELQTEIDARIKANGVPAYTLSTIDAADEAGAEGKIVGSCDGGSKRIVYVRGAAPAATSAADAAAAPSG